MSLGKEIKSCSISKRPILYHLFITNLDVQIPVVMLVTLMWTVKTVLDEIFDVSDSEVYSIKICGKHFIIMQVQYQPFTIQSRLLTTLSKKLEALERLYRSTGLIFLQWQKKFLTIIIQSLHFSSLKKKGREKTCEKRRKKW